jgi:hypothetical protein
LTELIEIDVFIEEETKDYNGEFERVELVDT